MKYSEINDFWPLLEAIKVGKTIQFEDTAGRWCDLVGGVSFDKPVKRYRIKPEKKKARKEEIKFILNCDDSLWGVPKAFWSQYKNTVHVGSPLTLYLDVETNQFIDPKNLGEYDVQE